MKVWNRGVEVTAKDKSHARHMLSVEEKESYKWIASSIKSKQVLDKAREVIVIQDREGDIYGQFCMVPDERTHLLIRAKTNRVLADKARLFEQLTGLPKQGKYEVVLERENSKLLP